MGAENKNWIPSWQLLFTSFKEENALCTESETESEMKKEREKRPTTLICKSDSKLEECPSAADATGAWGAVIHVCFFERIQTRAKNRAVFTRSE